METVRDIIRLTDTWKTGKQTAVESNYPGQRWFHPSGFKGCSCPGEGEGCDRGRARRLKVG